MKTVLVVDDSALVRRQVSNALKGAGYEAVEAVDGLDARDKLAATPAISMIVCDVTMPRMNGMEFLGSLAQDGTFKGAILMLTTEGKPELIARAKSLGAKGWLVKPFKPDLLLAAVAKLAV
ncbi:MAG TPA: response regulator [Kofleriaceae bacterium]|jgi:two-component system chemotaxis response regulator CheY